MASPYITIGSVAEILPGYAIKGRVEHDPGGCCQLIQGRHLAPGQPYRFRAEDELLITPRHDVERYVVHPGDVLLASRGTSNYTVEIREVPPRTIAPATYYVLRARADQITNYVPAYLAWVLEQAPTQAQIAQIRTSTATPIVQREDLNAVRIPLPQIEEQRRIAVLAELMQRELELLRWLEVATQHKHQAIASALYEGSLCDADSEPGTP